MKELITPAKLWLLGFGVGFFYGFVIFARPSPVFAIFVAVLACAAIYLTEWLSKKTWSRLEELMRSSKKIKP